MNLSIKRQTSVIANTKRAKTISGVRTPPELYLVGVQCTLPDPVDPELKQRMLLGTPHEVLQVFVMELLDIVEGDVFVMDSVDYPVKKIAKWPTTKGGFLQLFLEDLRV